MSAGTIWAWMPMEECVQCCTTQPGLISPSFLILSAKICGVSGEENAAKLPEAVLKKCFISLAFQGIVPIRPKPVMRQALLYYKEKGSRKIYRAIVMSHGMVEQGFGVFVNHQHKRRFVCPVAVELSIDEVAATLLD
ncbi:hypothetical protein DUI87_14540 [Hirundo rustica rustica]|uniref:Uncharacterized protein n=1 Tax=Hirundo rustica rustica TaxID=333673 RepID=A0A3M0K511_HIRRU|nr:hypothetical protein DUI87_14540 [Hirundo rustica rustica]